MITMSIECNKLEHDIISHVSFNDDTVHKEKPESLQKPLLF